MAEDQADRCRRNAATCRDLANQMSKVVDKEAWLKMAADWLKLAGDLDAQKAKAKPRQETSK